MLLLPGSNLGGSASLAVRSQPPTVTWELGEGLLIVAVAADLDPGGLPPLLLRSFLGSDFLVAPVAEAPGDGLPDLVHTAANRSHDPQTGDDWETHGVQGERLASMNAANVRTD